MFNIWSNEILKQAKDQQVDYVALPGDLWKSVTTNDNKGGVALMLTFIESLVKICPVCAIEGTPSHDAPGSYEILERAGLVLLKPGKVYGYWKGSSVYDLSAIPDKAVRVLIDNDCDPTMPDSIIFGVPELNKNNIHAKLNVSSEEANAKAVELFENYMDTFVAPMRLKYNDIPAHMLFHGNVSDSSQENSSDIIMRASDIIIHSDVFARANLTRVSLGHIHKPWESEICNMGYAGSPGLTWGERDFIPAMNLVNMGTTIPLSTIKRLPYGSPERKKVWKFKDVIPSDNIAYWVVTDDPTSKLPDGIHKWSRITVDEKNQKSTRRITEDEIDKVKSLWELALALDPETDPKLKPKFDMLQEKNKKEITETVDIQLNRVEVYGCKFFQGETAILDIDSLKSGLTSIGGEINGKQNGIGKSGILSFCSPFPAVIGKKPKEGGIHTLKYFFTGKDSRIVPQLENVKFSAMMDKCNELYGNYEDYLLTSFYIQPLQDPKASTSLMSETMTTIRDLEQGIAGIDRSQEKRMALDEIANLEEDLKGIDIKIKYAEDNIQNKDELLISLKESQEKLKLEIKEIEDITKKGMALKDELHGLTKLKFKNDDEKTRKEEKHLQVDSENNKILTTPSKIETLKRSISTIEDDKLKVSKYDADKIIVDKYNSEKKDYDHYLDKLNSLKNRKSEIEVLIENLIIPNKLLLEVKIEDYKLDLKLIEEWKESCQTVKDDNTTLNTNYSTALNNYNIAKNDYDNQKKGLENSIDKHSRKIDHFKQLIEAKSSSCPECGYIDPKIKTEIAGIEKEIDIEKGLKSNYEKNLLELKFTLEPPVTKDPTPLPDFPLPTSNEAFIRNELQTCENSLSNIEILKKQESQHNQDIGFIESQIKNLKEVSEPKPHDLTLDPDFIITTLKQKIEGSKNVEIEINTLQNELKNSEKRVKELEIDINNIIIDSEIDSKVAVKTEEIDKLRKSLTDIRTTAATTQEILKGVESKIDLVEIEEKKIQDMKDGIAGQLLDKEQWEEVAKLLGSNKIPALELEIMLDSIDLEATRILSPYQDGQYSFRTVTQNDKGTDKYDILIHDSLTGKEQSFLEFSPGVKAILSDSRVKSLLKRKANNKYNPTILDESDGPVGPKHIEEYYRIQENYYRQIPDKKVLIVSHKTESKAYIENFIDIKEIRCQ
jgi:DNA repair exonuclease SbcCD ATPase subunit